jgi:hypothetical protein
MKTRLFILLALAGCGVSSDRYASQYAEAECTYAISCFDAQILEFNNWVAQTVEGEERTAQEMCERDVAPRIMQTNQICATFDKKAAKQCLDEWETQGCPDNGADPDVPIICDSVFSDCVGDQPEE